MSTSIKRPQTAPSSLCRPSSNLHDLLIARARIHPHSNQTSSKSLHSSGSISNSLQSPPAPCPMSTIKPPTLPYTLRLDSISTNILQTHPSITITESSQYSPSLGFLNVDPESETEDIKSDHLSITSDSPNPSYSPIILKARHPIAGDMSRSLENLEDQEEDTETYEDYDPKPSGARRLISLQEFLNSTEPPRPISIIQDSSIESSSMKTFLGPKLTRHGDAPWSKTLTGDGDSKEGSNQSDPIIPHTSSPSPSFRQIPFALSHVLTGGARRKGSRARQTSGLYIKAIHTVKNAFTIFEK